jgi:hypothetical protein
MAGQDHIQEYSHTAEVRECRISLPNQNEVSPLTRSKSLKIAVVLLVTAGVFVWLAARQAPSERTYPGAVAMDASRLPAAMTVLGTRLTVTDIQRFETVGQINMTAVGKRQIVMESSTALMNGAEVPSLGSGFGTGSNPSEVEVSASFPLENGAGKLDLACVLQSSVRSGSVRFPFRGISPSSLPVTRKVGPVSVTLERIYYGTLPKDPSHANDPNKYVVLIYSQSGPPDNLHGEFTMSRDETRLVWSGPDPYWILHDDSQFRDQSGKVLPLSSTRRCEFGGAYDVFKQEVSRSTSVESLMTRLSLKRASAMITNRAMQAAAKSQRRFRFVAYSAAGSVPKRFTWEPTVNLPPRDRKQVKVIFRNIAIPPK